MRKLFTIIALMLIILLPASAHAQGEVVFDTVDVSVWPEYDTPTILVIYKISLPAQSTLPVDITLKMPPGVGKISAIAVGNSPDTVSDSGVDSRFAPGTDSSQVSVKATGRFIQIEYYDPDLVKSANQHSYTYKWPGDYAVNNFRFEFRQPLQSSNVSVEPALLNAVMDAEGFSVRDRKSTRLNSSH